METFSALMALCVRYSPVPDEFPAQRPMTRSSDVFFDLLWINGWVNNREAGELRRYRAHYDVTVMSASEMNLRWQSVTNANHEAHYLIGGCIYNHLDPFRQLSPS